MKTTWRYLRLTTLVLCLMAGFVMYGCGSSGSDGNDQSTNQSNLSDNSPTTEVTLYRGNVDCGGAGATGTITATILAPNGTTGIAAADVTVDKINCTGKSGTDGRIEFLNVPEGTYAVSAQTGIFNVSQDNVLVAPGKTNSTGNLLISGSAKKLAVIPGFFDSIGTVLGSLGFSYEEITAADLKNSVTLDQYDYLFLNCGLDEAEGDAGDSMVQKNLKDFVASGKRLYASDWAYTYVERVFPEAADFYGEDSMDGSAQVGDSGSVTATISNSDLATALGKTTMSVNFDLGSWVVMDGVGSGTEVLVKGVVMSNGISLPDRPLSVVFPHGDGKVVYTSFHNEAQMTSDMGKILERLIMQ